MAFVQSFNVGTTTTVNSASTPTTGITTTSNNLIMVGYASTEPVATIVDSYGNSFQAGPTNQVDSLFWVSTFYAVGIAGGPNYYITVTPSIVNQYIALIASEFSGRDTTIPIDQTNAASTSTYNQTQTGASVTTSTNGEDYWQFACDIAQNADTWTAGTGWTIDTNGFLSGTGSSYPACFVQYQTNQPAGTYTGNYTTTGFVRSGAILHSLISQRVINPVPPGPKQTFVKEVYIQY